MAQTSYRQGKVQAIHTTRKSVILTRECHRKYCSVVYHCCEFGRILPPMGRAEMGVLVTCQKFIERLILPG